MAKKILISKDKKQFKANLHCHSNLSDGTYSPEELKELYKSRGYDVLAITDHCVPKAHNELTDDDFLMLTAYEAYVRPLPNAKHSPYKPEIHMNLFAKDKDNVKHVCYNPEYVKYIPVEEHGKLEKVGSQRPREYTTEYINEFVQTAIDNGYIVSYNHPFWSMETEERILSYENFFSVEIYNTSSYTINNLENGEMIYDTLLRNGKRYACHGADDNHNKFPLDHLDNDSFGAFTMILADKLDYDSIIGALENHDCYASKGPQIHELSIVDGETVHVECSPCEKIILFVGGKTTKRFYAENGEMITSLDIPLPPKARFVRISAYDKDGKSAVTRGFFPDEWND